MKWNPIWLRRSAAAAITITLLVPSLRPASAAEEEKPPAAMERLLEVYQLLENKHVSAPDGDKLSDTAIKAMVDSLKDPHTQYFTAKELESFEDTIASQYVGIGVRVSSESDGVYISEVFEGSPAKEAGLVKGDLIVAVAGESVMGKPLQEVTSKIAGEPGTRVTLQITRGTETKNMDVARKKVQRPVVTSKRFDPGVGYIRVTSFSDDADDLMASQLDALKRQGITSLVVDLRDNPGGLLTTAEQMIKLFVKEGTLIHTRNRDKTDQSVTFTGGTTQPYPVYFLVNDGSASASEVLTGALQDYGVAKAVGTKTYGKGSVQNLYPLASGGAIKVTIEEYLTPKLRPVNHVGLTPDVAVEGGDVPELVTALRLAGVKQVDLKLDRKSLSVNGNEVEDSLPVLRENNETWIPARVLASVLGASVTWSEAARTVSLASLGGDTSFTPDNASFMIREGTGFVNLRAVAASWSGLTWSDTGRVLSLRYGNEGRSS